MRYFLGFLIAIGLIIFVFILVLKGFGGGDKSKPETKVTLTDYASSDAVMRYTTDGQINAEELHQGFRITIGRAEKTMEVYKGYQNQVTRNKSYPNNQEAFTNFLSALVILGYDKGSDDPNKVDERGYCPQGTRYIFEIIKDNSSIQRFWRTSCGQGNFGGKTSDIGELFQRQIPDYTTLTDNLTL